jgi:peptidoglycan/LPS O-acetylase OafA/YrhL
LLARLIDAGRYGVQAFLLISGLTIFLSIRARSEPAGGAPWRRFYIRRFARISLVAYAGMLVNILVNRPPVTPIGLLLTVVFLNGWSPVWYNTLILGGWVLSVLWMFYLAAPLIAKKVRTAASAAMLVVASACAGIALTLLGLAVRPEWGVSFFYMWPPAQLPVVALGVLLYYLTSADEPESPRWVSAGLLLAGAAAVTVVVLHKVPSEGGAQYVYSAIIACGLLALASRPVRLLVNPLTQWLGKISYSVFIWHFFVLEALVGLVGKPLSGIGAFAGLYCSAVVASAAVGWVSSVTLERASALLGRRLAARLAPAERNDATSS